MYWSTFTPHTNISQTCPAQLVYGQQRNLYSERCTAHSLSYLKLFSNKPLLCSSARPALETMWCSCDPDKVTVTDKRCSWPCAGQPRVRCPGQDWTCQDTVTSDRTSSLAQEIRPAIFGGLVCDIRVVNKSDGASSCGCEAATFPSTSRNLWVVIMFWIWDIWDLTGKWLYGCWSCGGGQPQTAGLCLVGFTNK